MGRSKNESDQEVSKAKSNKESKTNKSNAEAQNNKGKFASDDKCLNSIYVLSLIEVYNYTGLQNKDLAKALNKAPSVITTTIGGDNRSYAPSIPMLEACLEYFESVKPGSREYYHLLLLGLSPAKARHIVFDDDDEFREESIKQILTTNSQVKQIATYVSHIDSDALAKRLPLDKVKRLFFALIKKLFSSDTELDIPYKLDEESAENLIKLGFELGARPFAVGMSLSPQTVGEILSGQSQKFTQASTSKNSVESLVPKSTNIK